MKHNLRNALMLLLPIIAVACGSPAAPTTAPVAATAVPVAATVAPAATAKPADTAAPAATAKPADTAAPAATAAATATAATATAAGAIDKTGWPAQFTLGLFGSDDAEKVLKNAESLRLRLEKALGIPVKMFTGTSYTAVIEAMRAKRVDAMEVGPFSYTLAVQEAGAEAIAVNISPSLKPTDTAKYDDKLTPYYYSIIFTKKGSGIATLADLKGKGFNFVDPASTSGHLMPKTYLVNHGIDPDKDLKAVFAGSHPTSVLSVWNGKAPAGATYEDNMYALQDNGQVDFCGFPTKHVRPSEADIKAVFDKCPDGKLAVLAFTDAIPNTPFAVRPDLPASMKKAIKDTLLSIKDDPEMVAAYRQWYVDPSVALGLKSLDQFYDPLRDIAKILNLDLKKMK